MSKYEHHGVILIYLHLFCRPSSSLGFIPKWVIVQCAIFDHIYSEYVPFCLWSSAFFNLIHLLILFYISRGYKFGRGVQNWKDCYLQMRRPLNKLKLTASCTTANDFGLESIQVEESAMDYRSESSETLRNKCAACFRQFNRKEHLVEHMRISFHSVHEPMCGVCKKHCRSFESLREHLIGPLPKVECAKIFSTQGCSICLTILDSPSSVRMHRARCQLARPNNGLVSRFANLGINDDLRIDNVQRRGPQAVALACKMVGGGSDGSVDLCARVCLIDESENIIFHSYVKPQYLVSNYRYETTGIRPEHLRDAVPIKQVAKKIQDFLCNGEPMWKIRPSGGKAKILVGHALDRDLECLGIEYPLIMIRDTAKYPPLMKTSKLSNSLKYLTQAYLGYDIQTGIQDPYEDCVSVMRLYMRMRYQNHRSEDYPLATGVQNRNNFASWRESELERMAPEQLLGISRSDYYCWCLDSKQCA